MRRSTHLTVTRPAVATCEAARSWRVRALQLWASPARQQMRHAQRPPHTLPPSLLAAEVGPAAAARQPPRHEQRAPRHAAGGSGRASARSADSKQPVAAFQVRIHVTTPAAFDARLQAALAAGVTSQAEAPARPAWVAAAAYTPSGAAGAAAAAPGERQLQGQAGGGEYQLTILTRGACGRGAGTALSRQRVMPQSVAMPGTCGGLLHGTALIEVTPTSSQGEQQATPRHGAPASRPGRRQQARGGGGA